MSDSTNTNGEAPEQDYVDLKVHLQEFDAIIEADREADETKWLRSVQSAAHDLFNALEHHEDVSEEQGGTLPEVTETKPALMSERKRLEREHQEMLQRAEEIEESVERQFSFDERNTEMICLEASILRDILRLHLLRTDALMYEAYFQVEGGESG